jgi:nicotinamidase-related amidase
VKAGEKFSASDIGTHAYLGTEGIFAEGTWNAEIADETKSEENDTIIQNRNHLSAFEGTDLKAVLKKNNIQRLFLMGFLTNQGIEETVIELSEYMPS